MVFEVDPAFYGPAINRQYSFSGGTWVVTSTNAFNWHPVYGTMGDWTRAACNHPVDSPQDNYFPSHNFVCTVCGWGGGRD